MVFRMAKYSKQDILDLIEEEDIVNLSVYSLQTLPEI